jgi:hypothetical protein
MVHLERKYLDKLSPAPAGFVIRRNRTLFYDALDYKSNASLIVFTCPVNHAQDLVLKGIDNINETW